ncbi:MULTISPECIES: MotA/TolQ/ExbB proton channel family protein [unclassified Brenneria]|uniref:MotA/TolQ/ExbB proton channel family protein n=1 Tax=unclassified Brenneria TaxID=2634434 RepID=UPI0029C25C1F|nr:MULTISPECIES: MotA/TolQ/ExbB proton channel family protein [unclassified Brenneria]MDX5630848.1 MotA/TolQ/ExbB proton channel family protein [Brenneria sp. L3-3Z]MDX5697930.1 MotA/TolQ/ExbB proton channel family protein [Brenneria sp. L4-2C]
MDYNISLAFKQADMVTLGIGIVLILMSIGSWSVIIFKLLQLFRMRKFGLDADKRFWVNKSLREGIAALGPLDGRNPFQQLAEAARIASERHSETHLNEILSPDEWLQRCLNVSFEEQMSYLTKGQSFLASVGSTAPFVGLFGTVWGIYHALIGISAAGQSSLAEVSGPVGEALIMTAFGLFVAIPAVLAFNAISRGHYDIVHKLMRFRHELQAYIMSVEKKLS